MNAGQKPKPRSDHTQRKDGPLRNTPPARGLLKKNCTQMENPVQNDHTKAHKRPEKSLMKMPSSTLMRALCGEQKCSRKMPFSYVSPLVCNLLNPDGHSSGSSGTLRKVQGIVATTRSAIESQTCEIVPTNGTSCARSSKGKSHSCAVEGP